MLDMMQPTDITFIYVFLNTHILLHCRLYQSSRTRRESCLQTLTATKHAVVKPENNWKETENVLLQSKSCSSALRAVFSQSILIARLSRPVASHSNVS